MACDKYQEMLSAYLDQALNEDDIQQLETHLNECDLCRQELADLKETVAMLRSMAEVQPPVEFHQQLRQRLAEESRKNSQRPSLVSRAMRSAWLPLSAAAVLFITFVGIFGLMFLPMGGQFELAGDRSTQNMKIAQEEESYDKGEADEAAPEINSTSRDMDMNIAAVPDDGRLEKEQSLEGTRQESVSRKVIRRASFVVEVKDVQDSEQKLRQLAEQFGGYIQNASIRQDDEDRYFANLTLRVPEEKLNALVDEIKGLGEIKDSSMGGEDVTQEFYDTEARLKVMKEEEESLIRLLDKAEKIEDIMQVRRELSRVRQEIEVQEGRLKYLSQMTDMATVNVNLRSEEVPRNQISTTGMGGVWSRTLQAFIFSTNRLIKGLGEAVIGLGALLPMLVLLAAVILLLVGIVKLRKRSKTE